jgi:anti-sigma B factor antagonist
VNIAGHLRIDVRREADMVVLELHGELDLAGAPLLAEEIEKIDGEPPALLVLDLEDLAFIDSSGLRVILSAHERAGERGQALALTRGSQQVQRLLEIAGVSDHLRVIDAPKGTGPQSEASGSA